MHASMISHAAPPCTAGKTCSPPGAAEDEPSGFAAMLAGLQKDEASESPPEEQAAEEATATEASVDGVAPQADEADVQDPAAEAAALFAALYLLMGLPASKLESGSETKVDEVDGVGKAPPVQNPESLLDGKAASAEAADEANVKPAETPQLVVDAKAFAALAAVSKKLTVIQGQSSASGDAMEQKVVPPVAPPLDKMGALAAANEAVLAAEAGLVEDDPSSAADGGTQTHAMPGAVKVVDDVPVAKTESARGDAAVAAAPAPAPTHAAQGERPETQQQAATPIVAGGSAQTAPPQHVAAPEGTSFASAEHVQKLVGEQAVRHVRVVLDNGERSMSVRLAPPSLGEMKIDVQTSGGDIFVRLASANPQVREALHAQSEQIRQALQHDAAGLVQVEIASQFSARPDHSGQPGYAQAQGGAPPRWNLPGVQYTEIETAPRSRVHTGALDVLA